MRNNVEEDFASNLIKYHGKNSETINIVKEKLTEILDYRFPEYDRLAFHTSYSDRRLEVPISNGGRLITSLTAINVEKNMAAGYFSAAGFDGVIVFKDKNYEVKDDRGFPYLKYEENDMDANIMKSYQMAYEYGDDEILVDSVYYFDRLRQEISQWSINVRIYTNCNKGCVIDVLVPDYTVSTDAKDNVLEFKGNIRHLPDIRVFANQCCDYYHEKYTDIYVCHRK